MSGINDLHDLILAGTQVSDIGLEKLKRFNLVSLDLTSTKVTDAGLVHLRGMTRLQELNLVGTQVTDAGVADLQKALPKVLIRR